jgi:hypothetical protein
MWVSARSPSLWVVGRASAGRARAVKGRCARVHAERGSGHEHRVEPQETGVNFGPTAPIERRASITSAEIMIGPSHPSILNR